MRLWLAKFNYYPHFNVPILFLAYAWISDRDRSQSCCSTFCCKWKTMPLTYNMKLAIYINALTMLDSNQTTKYSATNENNFRMTVMTSATPEYTSIRETQTWRKGNKNWKCSDFLASMSPHRASRIPRRVSWIGASWETERKSSRRTSNMNLSWNGCRSYRDKKGTVSTTILWAAPNV